METVALNNYSVLMKVVHKETNKGLPGLLVVLLPLQLAGFPTGLTGYYQWLPALVFQVVLGLWLLIKGVATPERKIIGS